MSFSKGKTNFRRLATFLTVVAMLATAIVFGAPVANPAAADGHLPPEIVSEQPLRTWQVKDMIVDLTSSLTQYDILVWDFVEMNGVMYVGGRFENVRKFSGATQHKQSYLAAFDVATGTWISTFRPVLDDAVLTLAASPDGSRLLVGGEFSNVNGAPYTSAFAALDPFTGEPDPNWTASFTRENGAEVMVKDIQVFGDEVYVGGRFNHVEDHRGKRLRRYNIARLRGSDGSLDRDWTVRVSGGKVMSMALSPDGADLYLAGYFSSVSETPRTKWMAVASTVDGSVSAMADPIDPNRLYYVFEIEVTDNKVFAGAEGHRLFVWDRATNSQTHEYFSNGYGGDYQAIHQVGDLVYVGGHFHGWQEDRMNLGSRNNAQWLTAFDANTAERVDEWVARLGMNDGVFAIMDDSEGKLWVGGDPTSAGQIPVRGFAVFPASTKGQEVNLARGKTATKSSSGPSNMPFHNIVPETRCNNGLNPQMVGQADDAVDGKTTGGAWECSVSWTDKELNPWWQVDLGEVGEVDAIRIWNVYNSSGVRDQLSDVWLAVSETPINSADPVALAADPDVKLVQIGGELEWFDEQPIGVMGRYVQVFMKKTTAVQLYLPEVEVLDLPGVSPTPIIDGTKTLIEAGSSWKYSDNGQAPSSSWKAASFNDADWPEGPAPLGFGDKDIETVTKTEVLTTHMRHSFDVADPDTVRGLSLSLRADDGAVVYLNGVELTRLRMPKGPVDYKTQANETVWGAAEKAWSTFEVPSDALNIGNNVLSVEVHNNWRRGSDISFDMSLTAIDTVVTPPATDEVFINLDDTWRYLDNGTQPSNSWTTGNFDQAQWKTGNAQFGYGDGDEATEIDSGPKNSRYITSYFRNSFNVTDPNLFETLQISLIRDDGAAVYLNGQELLRDNLPSGALDSSTLASDYAWGPNERQPHVFTVPANALLSGNNVVSVEVHSADKGSKDLSFALELVGEVK